MEESEIVKAAKNYAIGEPTNKEDRREAIPILCKMTVPLFL